MSFILDALKKAESERNRRVAPVLMDARIASPRRGLPAWAWVLGAVLVVNVALVAWLLLRDPSDVAGNEGTSSMTPAPPAAAPAAGLSSVNAGAGDAATPAAPGGQPGMVATTPSPAISASPADAADTAPTIDPATLPTAVALRGNGVALPDLELNLHIYNVSPAQRSVLLNGQRVREGDYLPNGVKLERITPEGVVLEAAGRRFRIDAGG